MENLNLREILFKLQKLYTKLRYLAIALEEVQCLTNDNVLVILNRLSLSTGDGKIFDDLYKQIMYVWVDMVYQFVSSGIIFREFYITRIKDFGWDCFKIDYTKSPMGREVSEKILSAGRAAYYLHHFNFKTPNIVTNDLFEEKITCYHIENNGVLVACLVNNLKEFLNVSNEYLFFNNSLFREKLLDITFDNQILTFLEVDSIIPDSICKYLSISPGMINDLRGYIDDFDSQIITINTSKLLDLVISEEFILQWRRLSHRIWILARTESMLKRSWNRTDQHITRYEMNHTIRWLRLYYHQVTIEVSVMLSDEIISVDQLIGNVSKCVEHMKKSTVCEFELVELIKLWLKNYHLDKCHLKMSKVVSNMINSGILKNLNFNYYYH